MRVSIGTCGTGRIRIELFADCLARISSRILTTAQLSYFQTPSPGKNHTELTVELAIALSLPCEVEVPMHGRLADDKMFHSVRRCGPILFCEPLNSAPDPTDLGRNHVFLWDALPMDGFE